MLTFELPELIFLFIFAAYMAFHVYYCEKTKKERKRAEKGES